MKKITVLLLLFGGLINAQESKFTFDNKKGLTDFIVVPVESATASALYKKSVDWIKVTYSDPSKAILSTIENEYIRFMALGDYICFDESNPKAVNLDCYNVKYEIEISFKDGKYKFDIISLQRFETPSQYITGGWKNVLVFTTGITEEELSKILFKKDGTLKKQYITISKSADYFNSVNESLLKYITSSNKEKKDW